MPIVAITGQVGSAAIGTDAFQEADIRGITMPITKHNFLVKRTEDIPEAIKAAFHIASTGRPGPVLVDVAKDALTNSAPFDFEDELVLPGYKPTSQPHFRQIQEAARVICRAKRPVLYVGGGVIKARAWQELADLVARTDIPVVTTLMARGALPDAHPMNMGMPGMHGSVSAVGALQRADLLIAVGTASTTGHRRMDSFAGGQDHPRDIDPAEIGKNRVVDVPVVGTRRRSWVAIRRCGMSVPATGVDAVPVRAEGRCGRWTEPEDGMLSPQHVVQRIGEIVGPDAIYVTGVGQHQMWAAHFLPHARPAKWLTSGGAGTMGYCVPAAMGAKVGAPDLDVWGIDGDGCFQMTNQELVTCALNGIPIKIAVINNNALGMGRQWQTLFYDQRYSNTDLNSDLVPDFPKLAEAMGCVGLRATRPEEVDEVIRKAQSINDRPVVVEFVCHKDAMVWPMVAAGTSNDDIKIARDMAPEWEDEVLCTHTLSVLVDNKPGVLARISSLFSRRGFNIESLAVGPTRASRCLAHHPGHHGRPLRRPRAAGQASSTSWSR